MLQLMTLIEFTLDGDAVNASGRRVYLERFIPWRDL